MERKRLPIGTENFEKLRHENLYYVDKTGLIRELLSSFSDVTLFTRPRRFGKTLNMSMLRYFFEVGTDKSLFDGLDISKETALCEQHMGQYPVISISLKGVEGWDFADARRGLWSIISTEAIRFYDVLSNDQLNEFERKKYYALCAEEGNLEESLNLLSRLLYNHYGRKVVILIDEYDVPLDKAYLRGYYDQMILLIRQMLNAALKTNDALQLAVLTGCLRI
ncbi:MAG: AAA family ATPase, partial [Clostridiales bacterium]|nr:AAA family ATPase [Clostridiales bacterium]